MLYIKKGLDISSARSMQVMVVLDTSLTLCDSRITYQMVDISKKSLFINALFCSKLVHALVSASLFSDAFFKHNSSFYRSLYMVINT